MVLEGWQKATQADLKGTSQVGKRFVVGAIHRTHEGPNRCVSFFFFFFLVLVTVMGVPNIEAEEAAASSLSELITRVPIALLPGRLPLRVLDCIHILNSHVRS